MSVGNTLPHWGVRLLKLNYRAKPSSNCFIVAGS